jgi:hypothetical protein
MRPDDFFPRSSIVAANLRLAFPKIERRSEFGKFYKLVRPINNSKVYKNFDKIRGFYTNIINLTLQQIIAALFNALKLKNIPANFVKRTLMRPTERRNVSAE